VVRAAVFLRAVAAATCALALVLASCGGSDGPAAPAGPEGVVSSAAGAFTLTTLPGDAQAGLRFAGFVTEGTVVIKNEGRRAGSFALRQEIEFEAPSAGARSASANVGLRIVDRTGEGSPLTLYRGPVAELSSVSVGEIPAGSSREYGFTLTPRTPLRATRLDLGYRWVPGSASAPPPPSERPASGQAPPRVALALGIPHEQRVLDTRRIVVLARCSRRCRLEGQAALRAPGRAPIDLPVSIEQSPSAALPARVRLRASREAFPAIRAALTRGPVVSVTLRVRAGTGDGGSALATERIRLRPVADRERRGP